VSSARLYALQEFMVTYFHQDWMYDDATTADVAHRFGREAEPEFRAKVMADIRDLLNRPLSEEELHGYLLKEYSVAYDPWRDEISTREWLEGLLQQIGSGRDDVE
jgi:contact-dependent growth inhibition (CDI) system CdiI-like immunity protein